MECFPLISDGKIYKVLLYLYVCEMGGNCFSIIKEGGGYKMEVIEVRNLWTAPCPQITCNLLYLLLNAL